MATERIKLAAVEMDVHKRYADYQKIERIRKKIIMEMIKIKKIC